MKMYYSNNRLSLVALFLLYVNLMYCNITDCNIMIFGYNLSVFFINMNSKREV